MILLSHPHHTRSHSPDAPNNTECFLEESNAKQNSLVRIVTLPEEDENEHQETASITLNLDSTSTTEPLPPHVSIQQEHTSTPTKPMASLLSREYTFNTPNQRSSHRHRSTLKSVNATPVQQSVIVDEQTDSPSIPSKSMLGILLTNATESRASQTLHSSVLTPLSPRMTRPSKCLSINPSAKVSMTPLQSSTPSAKRQTMQMVSIGEQEQVSITVPQQDDIDLDEEQPQIEIVPLNDTANETTPVIRTMEIGIQTTPSLDSSSRRRWNTMEQQTTPVALEGRIDSSPASKEEITPVQDKVLIQLQRNVRFQLTPSTDARLARKEEQEQHLLGLKPEIVFESSSMTLVQTIQEQPKRKPAKKATKAPKVSRKTPMVRIHLISLSISSVHSPLQKKKVQPKTPKKSASKDAKKKSVPALPENIVPSTKRNQRKQPVAKAVAPIVTPTPPAAKRSKPIVQGEFILTDALQMACTISCSSWDAFERATNPISFGNQVKRTSQDC